MMQSGQLLIDSTEITWIEVVTDVALMGHMTRFDIAFDSGLFVRKYYIFPFLLSPLNELKGSIFFVKFTFVEVFVELEDGVLLEICFGKVSFSLSHQTQYSNP